MKSCKLSQDYSYGHEGFDLGPLVGLNSAHGLGLERHKELHVERETACRSRDGARACPSMAGQ